MLLNFEYEPTVDNAHEFVEIARDFANPLEIVREAISNAFDASATRIEISFRVEEVAGERDLVITLTDNGVGMDSEQLKGFFDLGKSTRRGNPDMIGEKGHGTKVYFNSSLVEVTTWRDNVTYFAQMSDPLRSLEAGTLPRVRIEQLAETRPDSGTIINVRRYNHNRRELFTHGQVVDYLKWFTKAGSIEQIFGIQKNANTELWIKGLDRSDSELIKFGHTFPDESLSINALFDKHKEDAPDYYSKRVLRSGHLPDLPEIKFDAIYSIEGSWVKYASNAMLKRRGYTAPTGAYNVQDRYGLWLCKDFIPAQQQNNWISPVKGTEYTRFHAFINCQALRLTANRGSVNNTPSDILLQLQKVVEEHYREITSGSDWDDLEWLEQEAVGARSVDREKLDLKKRVQRAEGARVANFQGATVSEPLSEVAVYGLFVQISTLNPNAFPFAVIDYNTHTGYDVIAIGDRTAPLDRSKHFYIEFKLALKPDLNHSFENLTAIVCWDTSVQNGAEVRDTTGTRREMKILAPTVTTRRTQYFLDDPRSARKIEVFVLKDYLREVLGLEFRPRSVQI